MARIPNEKPTSRDVSARGLCYALDGNERPYDVYRFSGGSRFENPNHNPFAGLRVPLAFTLAFDAGFE